MNLKYYLRGLGLGIILTAVVMGIAANGRKETLTDAEIIIKAKELGMIDDSDLRDYVEKAKVETEKSIRAEVEKETRAQIEAEVRAEVEKTVRNEDIGETSEEITEESTDGEAEEEASDDTSEPVVFHVKKGETPSSISERLEENGLVSVASDFHRYLVDNGYDRRIVAAEYKIPVGADMETVARIITGHRVTEENLTEEN